MKRLGLLGAAMIVAFGATARAQTGADPPRQAEEARLSSLTLDHEDPLEPANRRSYAFGQFIDHFAFRPLAMCYRRWLPHPVRAGISNIIANLDEPEVGVNDLLQGRPKRAGVAALRFGMNTTLGLAGVFDLARRVGLQHHDNDAGITLARYGITPGPYLYIPVAGPSSVRDLVGAGVDFVLDPLGWVNFKNADTAFDVEIAADALASRADADPELRDLSHTAADPYATMRSYYLQSRAALARGSQLDINDLPEIPDTPATSPIADDSGSAESGRMSP